MNSASSYLVIINGAPGVGKTTLARRLQKDLGVSLVAKDMFKEFLFDTIGTGDREWSFTLGKEAISFCYHFTKLCAASGRPVIFESAFWAEHARGDMQRLMNETGVRALEIYCTVDEEERLKRFNKRLENGERHDGHADSITDTFGNIEKYEPLDISQRTTIDTGDFDDAKYNQLLSSIKQFAKGE